MISTECLNVCHLSCNPKISACFREEKNQHPNIIGNFFSLRRTQDYAVPNKNFKGFNILSKSNYFSVIQSLGHLLARFSDPESLL